MKHTLIKAIMKNEKKNTRGYNFTHMPTPPTICSGHRTLHVGADGGRNQTRKISSESLQGFWSPRG